MHLSEEEYKLLGDLVGKKATKVLVPLPRSAASKPVETVLVLADDKGVLIDSCFRQQRSSESPQEYPQMRVRMIDEIPEYPNGETIEFDEHGGIIRSVDVTNEQLLTRKEYACYAKAIHIAFTGRKELTITRETFRSPSLAVYEKEPDYELEQENPQWTIQTVREM